MARTDSTDNSSLDNPAYASLSTVHSRFAQRSGRVLRYPEDIIRFLGLPSPPTDADWQDAAKLVRPGGMAAIIHTNGALPNAWTVAGTIELFQMTGDDADGADEPDVISLGPADVQEMMELVRLTTPGPFSERTIELGEYVGIRRNGGLVAMGGERLHFTGWTEISAVCTAPDHRGTGMASRVMSALTAGVHRRFERPFLHVARTNTSAIRLYESLGFRVRRALTITLIARA
jgi:predicted GNAT family acetyltransferase